MFFLSKLLVILHTSGDNFSQHHTHYQNTHYQNRDEWQRLHLGKVSLKNVHNLLYILNTVRHVIVIVLKILPPNNLGLMLVPLHLDRYLSGWTNRKYTLETCRALESECMHIIKRKNGGL